MKKAVFDLEERRLKEELKKRGAKRVLIQLPEGLKSNGPRLANIVEETGALAVVSADPCYGACDLTPCDADSLGVDLVVHFGHSPFKRKASRIPTLYFEAKATMKLKPAVRSALGFLRSWKTIGLVTTVQHAHMLHDAKECLVAAGKHVAIGNAGRQKHAGQVIGCDYSNARAVAENVDAFLFIGGGRFHALGVALSTSKSTVVADPYECRAYSVDSEAQRVLKQRWASIHEAVESKHFGILIGLKTWQTQTEVALRIRNRLKAAGRKTTLLTIHEVMPEALLQFPTIDAYVNTACPRISLDDATRFHRPVLTIREASVVTGELTWEELLKEGLFVN